MEKTSEPRHHRGIVKRRLGRFAGAAPGVCPGRGLADDRGAHGELPRDGRRPRLGDGRRLQPALDLSAGDHPDPARRATTGALVRQLSAGRRRADDAGGRLDRQRRAAPRAAGAARARPRARRDRRGAGDPLGPAHPARRPGGPRRLGGHRAAGGRAGRHRPRRGVVPLVVLAGRLSVRGRAGPLVARARALDRRPPRPRPGFPSGAGRTAGLPSRGRRGRTFGLVRDALGPAPRLARGTGHHRRDDRRVGRARRASLDGLAGPRSGHAARGAASTGADHLRRIRAVFQFLWTWASTAACW